MTKINERFIVNLKGKQFVTYEGLLDLAHQMGLVSIKTEMIKFVSDGINDTVIVKAVASTKDKEFHGIGDASPQSVNAMIKPHMIRMAETRAKARALRDLTNVGMTAIEEMMDDEPQTPSKKPHNKSNQFKTDSDKQAIVDNSLASDAQVQYITNLLKKKKFDEKQMAEYLKKDYNKTDIKALTKKEAGDTINMLNEM